VSLKRRGLSRFIENIRARGGSSRVKCFVVNTTQGRILDDEAIKMSSRFGHTGAGLRSSGVDLGDLIAKRGG